MTLRAYVSMLKFQDKLHSHPYFHKAATGAIWCYVKLHDSPSKSSAEEEEEMSRLPPSQRKKLRQKQRKAEARAKKEAEGKNEEESSSVAMSKTGKRQNAKAVDLDPHGEKLLQVEDPLLEATKYLKLLQNNSANSLETHLLSFELNMRKQKILLAFQAVKQMLKLDENNPDTHRCLIRFFHKISTLPSPVTDSQKLIWNVLESERPNISQLHGKSLAEANQAFLERHKDSLMHRAAAAEMLFSLEPGKKLEALKLIEDSTNNLAPPNGVLGPVNEWKLQDCIAVHKLLITVFDDIDAASRWKTRCAGYFPYSIHFGGRNISSITDSANQSVLNVPENGVLHCKEAEHEGPNSINGKLHAFQDLTV